MIEIFVNLFIFWFVYSFIGWICEVIYAKAMKKGFDVRNATLGPINPSWHRNYIPKVMFHQFQVLFFLVLYPLDLLVIG